MENNVEIVQILSKLDRKTDKILKMLTLLVKAFHLVPVTEKEEREIQLLQRKSAATMQKIQEEFANLEEKPKENTNSLNFGDLFNSSQADVYSDIIGDDYISQEE